MLLFFMIHLEGDCRQILPTLPAKSVQCVVTSPPYADSKIMQGC